MHFYVYLRVLVYACVAWCIYELMLVRIIYWDILECLRRVIVIVRLTCVESSQMRMKA